MRSIVKWLGGFAFTSLAIGIGTSAVHAWSNTPWQVECVDPAPCAPADEVYGTMLAHASQWLASFGFARPSLAPDANHPGAFVAEVNDPRITVTDASSGEQVEYVGVYFANARQLVLRSDEFFTLGEPGQSEDDAAFQNELIFQFTPVHELFHAVQNTHLRLDEYASQQDKAAVDWIIEGTATSVQAEYARAFDAESGAQRNARSFATPLHRPDDGESRGTWLFWSSVGEAIGSPGRIAWFRDVIEPGRLTDDNALDRVDDALANQGKLRRQLPLFFSRQPVDRFDPVDLRAEAAGVPQVFRYPMSVREVAGQGARVSVVAPAGKDVTVNFSLESGTGGAPASEDLHLVVNGEVHPQGVADYGLQGGREETFDVVVANVGTKASDSKPRNFVLKVTLLGGECSFWADVSGDAGGAYQGDVAYFNALEEGQGVEKGMAAGTVADAGMHDQLQGLMGMMGGFAKMAEEMGLEVDEETKRKLEAIDGQDSQAVEETRAFEQEVLHSGSDNFGLTLQAQPGGTSNRLGGLAALLGVAGFNLGASGQAYVPQGPGLEGALDFQPSMVYATVGLTDADSQGVKFVWEEGKPGYAVLSLQRDTGSPVVRGTLEAELHAEHVYASGRPKIHVTATFVAREGIQSCMN